MVSTLSFPSTSSGLLNNWTSTIAPLANNDSSQGYSVGSYWQEMNSGVRWTCRDATVNAAIWIRNDNADFFSYVAGRYYADFGVSQTQAGSAIPVGTMRLYPIIVKERHSPSSFGLRFTTVSANGNAQAAQYRSDPATRFAIGTPVAQTGNITTAGAAAVMATTNITPSLEAGLYWMAVQCDNATAIATSLTNNGAFAMQVIGSTSEASAALPNPNINYSVTGQTFGTWPDLTNTTLTETLTSTAQSWYIHRYVNTTY